MQKKDASSWTQWYIWYIMATHVTGECSFHLPNKDSSGNQEAKTQLSNIICRYPPCLSQDCSALQGCFSGQTISSPACWCYSCPVLSAAFLLCLPSASDYTSPAHQQRAALELYKQEVTLAFVLNLISVVYYISSQWLTSLTPYKAMLETIARQKDPLLTYADATSNSRGMLSLWTQIAVVMLYVIWCHNNS